MYATPAHTFFLPAQEVWLPRVLVTIFIDN